MVIWTSLQVILLQIILPSFLIYKLWRADVKNRLDWLLIFLLTITFITWLFLTGRWDWTGYYIRYIWPLLLLPAVYVSWRKTAGLPFRSPIKTRHKWARGLYIALFVLFGLYNLNVLSGYTTDNEAINLAFPLQSGTYYVGHGGSSSQLNYHNVLKPQEYALDILALNNFGFRAAGLYPKDLNKYAIYNDAIYAPCSGKITETRDKFSDLTPGQMNADQPMGNHTSLVCEGKEAVVHIAHMQKGSITVSQGNTIQKGEKLGTVGNSGNTSEPHLHIHAEKDGAGIPIQFDETFLTRNDLIRTNK